MSRELKWQQAKASTHSGPQGCVQVAVDWVGSEKSPLEVGTSDDCGLVYVRDSHNTDVVMTVPREPDWRYFIEAVKLGEFDNTVRH